MQESVMPHENLPAEAIQLLRARAKRLTGSGEDVTARSLARRKRQDLYLCFRLLDERYGLSLDSVREVVGLRSIALVPGAPEHVVGLVRLRGKVLTLVDLRRFWRGATGGQADSDLAIVVEETGIEFGLVCTEVEDLAGLTPDEIKEVPQNLPTQMAANLRGLAKREIMLVHLKGLLAQPGFLVRLGG